VAKSGIPVERVARGRCSDLPYGHPPPEKAPESVLCRGSDLQETARALTAGHTKGGVTMRTLALATVLFILPSPQSDAVEAELEVAEAAVATAVVDREPEGRSTSFAADVGHIYFWTRITGADTETMVEHVWYRGDEEVARVQLLVGSPNWRTWSRKTVPSDWTGDWRVEAVDANGNPVSNGTIIGFTTDTSSGVVGGAQGAQGNTGAQGRVMSGTGVNSNTLHILQGEIVLGYHLVNGREQFYSRFFSIFPFLLGKHYFTTRQNDSRYCARCINKEQILIFMLH
jgi:hypothetical protein